MLPLVCDACPDVTWLRGGRWGASPAMSDTLLTGERRVLELVATGAPLSAVLDAICALLEHPPRVLASIYLLARDGQTLSFAAGPHIPDAWRAVSASFRITATSGACGAAITGRSPVVVDDIESNPLYLPVWREAARTSDLVGSWSTPFFASDGQPLGTCVLVGPTAWTPTDEQRRAVDRAAYLAGIAVELHQTEAFDARERTTVLHGVLRRSRGHVDHGICRPAIPVCQRQVPGALGLFEG